MKMKSPLLQLQAPTNSIPTALACTQLCTPLDMANSSPMPFGGQDTHVDTQLLSYRNCCAIRPIRPEVSILTRRSKITPIHIDAERIEPHHL
jgi:hypothetical protein